MIIKGGPSEAAMALSIAPAAAAMPQPPDPKGIEERLRRAVIGQPEALQELTKCYRRYRAGLGPQGRPQGIFLLIGPTGSGKSLLATQFARVVTGNDAAPLRIDCAEYREGHEVAKLTGSPPGYLGHRETPPILRREALTSQWADGQRLSVVLLDEVEKAHPKFIDLFLGVFDSGILTMGDNARVDFSQTIFILTGNIGAKALAAQHDKAFGLGGAAPQEEVPKDAGKVGAERAAKRLLRPEMYNRLDKVLVFNTLTREDLRAILDLELAGLAAHLLTSRGLVLTVTEPARELLLADGYDPIYGARHLKRSIDRNLTTPLADFILEFSPQQVVQARARDGKVIFTTER